MNRHHKRRRFATLAACVGTTAALAVLGSAGAASASVTCGAPGFASGSSFQSTAQHSVFLTSAGWGAHSSCSVAPTASTLTYTATASGPGLEEFGNTAGHFLPEKDPTAFGSGAAIKDKNGDVLDFFVGTDDAPTPRELGEAALAAGTLHSQKAEITIPIAQEPMAIMLSLPAGCKLLAGSSVDLNNTTLPQLWEGTTAASGGDPGGVQAQNGYAINTWGAFFSQLGYTKITSGSPTSGQFLDEEGLTGCGQEIKPQVRQTSSGTSFVFKSYLAQVNPSVWNGFAADAPTWPNGSVVTTNLKTGSGTEFLKNDTGGHLAQNTAANAGSVGYTNTADAASSTNGGFTNAATISKFSTGTPGTESPEHQIVWAEVQNNGLSTSGATYTDPVVSGGVGNCETSKILPAEEGFPYSYTDSWYGLLASDPNISEDASAVDYPICGLTYDLVFHHYSNKHLYGQTTTAHEVANTVKDLFEYITGPGQSDIQSHDYTRYPTGFQSHVSLAVNPGIGF
ncbi:MAG TPA: hypothetical protein VIC06_08540 [Solirubrobacteraceae bacterium]